MRFSEFWQVSWECTPSKYPQDSEFKRVKDTEFKPNDDNQTMSETEAATLEAAKRVALEAAKEAVKEATNKVLEEGEVFHCQYSDPDGTRCLFNTKKFEMLLLHREDRHAAPPAKEKPKAVTKDPEQDRSKAKRIESKLPKFMENETRDEHRRKVLSLIHI